MSAFDQNLSDLAGRIPGVRMLIIMDTDGIPVARWDARPDPLLEAVAAEYTTLLRASLAAASDTGLGALREVTVASEKMTALMSAITAGVLPLRRPRTRGWPGPGALRPARGRPEPREGVRLRRIDPGIGRP